MNNIIMYVRIYLVNETQYNSTKAGSHRGGVVGAGFGTKVLSTLVLVWRMSQRLQKM